MQYYVKFWASCFKKDTNQLDWVQKKIKRMVTGLENITSEEKLKELGLFSLELRRLKGTMTAGHREVKIGDGNKQFSMPSMNSSNVKQN